MATTTFQITIRPYTNDDRTAVREICTETAFLESSERFMDSMDLLADMLSLYFTDYEPQSCFVAEVSGKVVGYVMGTININRMNHVFTWKVMPRLVKKIIFTGALLSPKNLRLIWAITKSLFRGEFLMPDFSDRYKATLHINLNRCFRGQRIGDQLMQRFEQYLKENKLEFVYASTLSEHAKDFFISRGFEVLFYRRRSYLKYRLGKNLNCYVLGKRLIGTE
jgi:ribosomal protein S18 acetylase RimI-like enzyme